MKKQSHSEAKSAARPKRQTDSGFTATTVAAGPIGKSFKLGVSTAVPKKTVEPKMLVSAKTLTTPADASRAQKVTAQRNGGKPDPWVGKLQRAADKNFGKSGERKKAS